MYVEHVPAHDLADVVACTWIGRAEVTPTPIIPDACSDVVLVNDDPPHIAGPATRTYLVQLAPHSVVVGIRFKPGAARAIFGCSAAELRDRDTDLADVCVRSEIGRAHV